MGVKIYNEPPAFSPEAILKIGFQALENGREKAVLPYVVEAVSVWRKDQRLWQLCGLLHRNLSDLPAAVQAFEKAASLAPHDARIAKGHAQCSLEAGYASVPLFNHALSLARSRQDVLPGLAAALIADGESCTAFRTIDLALEDDPFWTEGHWISSRLHWQFGETKSLTKSIQRAASSHPGHVGLWRQFISILMGAERYDRALAALRNGRAAAGDDRGFLFDEAACLTESGRLERAENCFALLSRPSEPAEAVFLVRHLLRCSRPFEAAALAEPLAGLDGGRALLPYISLAWRLLGDERWFLLDGDEDLVQVYDIAQSLSDLEQLADVLRRLHFAKRHPVEQSLNGGTQTDGMLFRRAEPSITGLRKAIETTMGKHLTALPGLDPIEAQLGSPSDQTIRFSGSWSARLLAKGFHANHTHPMGRFSGVLYVAVPEPSDLGTPPAGWLTFGQPQENLGLALEPIKVVEPKAGRLVIFPSTMWHGTVPFAQGERLTVSFDIAF